MLFLATPHQGSSHSKLLNKILGMVPTKTQKQYVRDLNISSVTIRTIDELFKSINEDLILASCYETFPLKIGPGLTKVGWPIKTHIISVIKEANCLIKMIVEPHHAVLGVDRKSVV